MRRYTLPLVCLMVILTVGRALGATSPEQRAAVIAPFVDDQTVAVGYLDLAAVDPEAVAAEMEHAGVPKQAVTAATLALKKNLTSLRDAGVHEVYVVASTAYLMSTPIAVVVPLPQGADADAVAKVLREGRFGPQAVVRGAVVAAQERVLDIIRREKAVHRPELDAAFAAAGDAPVVAAMIPTADNRRVIEETLPALPKQLGGGPSSVLTRGVTWAAASLQLPPKMSVLVAVRSSDGQAAQALAGWVDGLKASVPPLASLTPQVGPDGVTFRLSADDLRALVEKDLVPLVSNARAESLGVLSRSNMHQMLIAMMMYRQDHQKQWPDNLQQLLKYLGDARMLRNPMRPDLEVG